MKKLSKIKIPIRLSLLVMAIWCLQILPCAAQDSTAVGTATGETPPAPKKVFVKNTFGGNYIIDNQTVMVPVKGTFEFAIQHRFGIVNNGYQDFYGFFAPANIRLAINYAPIKDLQIGIGLCKVDMVLDGNVKYAILKQAESGGSPVSVTIFANMGISTLPAEGNFVTDADRISYFSQLMVARKITKKLSVQVAGSVSYFNNIAGYTAPDGTIQPKMKNANTSVSFMGRYKVNDVMAIIANYDQPLTQNTTNNPHPNICFGIELTTTGHSFQVFAGNGTGIVPQYVNVFNQNDCSKGQFLIGFNITRRWYH